MPVLDIVLAARELTVWDVERKMRRTKVMDDHSILSTIIEVSTGVVGLQKSRLCITQGF